VDAFMGSASPCTPILARILQEQGVADAWFAQQGKLSARLMAWGFTEEELIETAAQRWYFVSESSLPLQPTLTWP